MKVITIVITYVLHGNATVFAPLATSPKKDQRQYLRSSAIAVKIRVWWRGYWQQSANPSHTGCSHRREQCRTQPKKRWKKPLFVTTNRWMDVLLTWCWRRFSEALGGISRDMAVGFVLQKSWVAAVEAQPTVPPKPGGDGGSDSHTHCTPREIRAGDSG